MLQKDAGCCAVKKLFTDLADVFFCIFQLVTALVSNDILLFLS